MTLINEILVNVIQIKWLGMNSITLDYWFWVNLGQIFLVPR